MPKKPPKDAYFQALITISVIVFSSSFYTGLALFLLACTPYKRLLSLFQEEYQANIIDLWRRWVRKGRLYACFKMCKYLPQAALSSLTSRYHLPKKKPPRN